MDRFFYYLIGAMAALLVTASVVFYMRPRETVETVDPNATPTATPAPTLTPSPWSANSGEPAVMATPEPTPTIAPAPTPFPWTPPNFGRITTVIYPGFTVVYSDTLRSPLAVQYAMVQGAKPRRYPEPAKVKTLSPKLIADAGYARADLAYEKSISLYFGKQSGANARLMVNSVAMDPATLAGPWTQLSEMERRYSGEYKWIEMVAGPVFGNPPVGVQSLPVPVAFYRVYRRSFGDCIAFVIPQGATSTEMGTYLTSVTAVEAATGVAIFANTLTPEAREQVAAGVW